MSAAVKVLVVAEGPSEIGNMDLLSGVRDVRSSCEGFVPPMLRKLLDVPIQIDAQKVTTLGRYEAKRRLEGHGDRAAKALALAATNGYRLVVFVKDVDKQPGKKKSAAERRKKLQKMHDEIRAGFDAVEDADAVARVKATPCRMIEAWALGDLEAIRKVRGTREIELNVPRRPEELWGDEKDRTSSHPKCVLRRALGQVANARLFEQLAREADPATLRTSCPESFAPFADEVAQALTTLTSAKSPPKKAKRGEFPHRGSKG